jgi:hypothetical protein
LIGCSPAHSLDGGFAALFVFAALRLCGFPRPKGEAEDGACDEIEQTDFRCLLRGAAAWARQRRWSSR